MARAKAQGQERARLVGPTVHSSVWPEQRGGKRGGHEAGEGRRVGGESECQMQDHDTRLRGAWATGEPLEGRSLLDRVSSGALCGVGWRETQRRGGCWEHSEGRGPAAEAEAGGGGWAE